MRKLVQLLKSSNDKWIECSCVLCDVRPGRYEVGLLAWVSHCDIKTWCSRNTWVHSFTHSTCETGCYLRRTAPLLAMEYFACAPDATTVNECYDFGAIYAFPRSKARLLLTRKNSYTMTFGTESSGKVTEIAAWASHGNGKSGKIVSMLKERDDRLSMYLDRNWIFYRWQNDA